MDEKTPWLTPKQAAARAQVGVKTVYREVAAGRLKAARVGGRRELVCGRSGLTSGWRPPRASRWSRRSNRHRPRCSRRTFNRCSGQEESRRPD
jgi:excisionase family DNA binding protein